MKRIMTIVSLFALALFGCATGRTAQTTGPSPEPTRQVASADELPSGSNLSVELDEALGADNEVGDRFTATVTHNVEGPGGRVVIPAGAKVHGEVTGIDRSENMNDPAAIRLHFNTIDFDGVRHPLNADVISTELTEERDKSDIVRDVAIGTAAGAILGAVIGRDVTGAVIGGALGAGAGTVIALGTGDVDPELKEGTEIVLRTTDDVAVATR